METLKPTGASGQPPVHDEAGSSESGGSFRICLLRFEQEVFAIDLTQVREVFKIDAITPVPGMPSALVGVANIRGSIVPVVDVRPSLGLSSAPRPHYAVVVWHGVRYAGILVDAVPEIQTADFGDLVEMPIGGGARSCPFLFGALNITGHTIEMIDVSRLLAMVDGRIDRQAA